MRELDSTAPKEEVFDEVAAGEKHRPWLGLLLSLWCPGASQFVAGLRMRGVLWFIGVYLTTTTGVTVMALPVFQGIMPGVAVLIISLGLFIVMLRDSYRALPKLGWKWSLFVVMSIAANNAAVELTEAIVGAFSMPTRSMEPTIRGNKRSDPRDVKGEPGTCDRVLVQRYAYWFDRPQRGDIVVFETEGMEGLRGDYYLKRIVALPGERVSISGGRLFINGLAVNDPRVFKKITYACPPADPLSAKHLKADKEEFEVPPRYYFVLGDNSARSADSRYWGPVPEANIVGKVTKIFWPLDRIGVPE